MGHIGILAHSADGAALCFLEMVREASRQLGAHQHPEITLSILPMGPMLELYEAERCAAIHPAAAPTARHPMASAASAGRATGRAGRWAGSTTVGAIRPSVAPPSAAANSAAVAKRSAGSFCSAVSTADSMWAGTLGRAGRIGRGASVMAMIACAVEPLVKVGALPAKLPPLPLVDQARGRYDWVMDPTHLPGADLIAAGLDDLRQGLETVPSLLVSIGAPRLARLGYSLPEPLAEPERRLYDLLARDDPAAAHSRYNGLIRRLVSFERAAECER